MPNYSIQIQSVLFHNDKESLFRALDALCMALAYDRSHEGCVNKAIIRYGDASEKPIFSDEEISNLNSEYGMQLTVDYLFFNENTGTARGHNILASGSDADYFMVMNPDVLVAANFFDVTLPIFKQRQRVGLVEARQTPIEHPKDYNLETGETGWSSTAAVVFPRSIFEEVGGFDADSFFMYCDDVDFSWRIRLHGYKLIYQPRAVVFHAKRLSISGKWQSTSAEVYYSAEAALFMAYKWSNDALLKKLLSHFCSGDSLEQKKAVEVFESCRLDGKLPLRLDANHKIGYFVSGCYTKHRFAL